MFLKFEDEIRFYSFLLVVCQTAVQLATLRVDAEYYCSCFCQYTLVLSKYYTCSPRCAFLSVLRDFSNV